MKNKYIVYYAFSLFLLVFMSMIKSWMGDANLPPLMPPVRGWINVLLLNFVLSFVLVCRRAFSKDFSSTTWAVLAALGAWVCFSYPVFSGDLWEYLIRGRLLVIYRHNPYLYYPEHIPQDLLYSLTSWYRFPQAYGPVALLLQSLVVLIFRDSVIGLAWGFKMMNLMFLAMAIYFFWRIIKKAGIADSSRVFLLFAFNPLLVVATLVDGHNDTMTVALCLTAVYCLLERRFSLCFLFWSLSFLIKYPSILILPFLIIKAVKLKMSQEGRIPWFFMFQQIAFNAILLALFFAPFTFRGILGSFHMLLNHVAGFYTNSIPYAAWQGLSLLGVSLDRVFLSHLFFVFFALAYASFLMMAGFSRDLSLRAYFRIISLAYLVFYIQTSAPFNWWYLVWALPWLVLSEWPLGSWLVLLYSMAGLFAYFKRINYLFIVAAAVYFTGLFVTYFIFRNRKSIPAEIL